MKSNKEIEVRTKSMLRRVLLPFALLVGLMAVSAPGAQAWSLSELHYWNGPLKPGYVGTVNNGFNPVIVTGNIAAYEGAGSVSVCQRTYDYDVGVYREGCAINAVGNALNLTPYYGHALFPGVKNNSGATHTLQGWLYQGYP